MRKKRQPQVVNAVVIGVEHIGACLLPALCQVLAYGSQIYRFDRASLLIADPIQADSVTSGLRREFESLELAAVQTTLTGEKVAELIPQNSVVFCCTSNLQTVRIVSDHCEKLSDVTAIRGGCDLTDGAIQMFARRKARNVTLPFANPYHPELQKPKADDFDYPQLLITNFAIASLMLNAFHAYLTDQLGQYDEAYLDVTTQRVRSSKRSPLA